MNFEVRRQRSERRTRPTWASCSSSSWRCARARIDKLQNAVDSGGGGSTLALSGAASGAVASQRRWSKRRATRRLLELGAASLRLEADGAQESAEAAEREALAASAELARLHSQLAQLTKRVHAFEAAAARGGNSSSSSPRAVSSAYELGAALGAVEASEAGGAALSVDKGEPAPCIRLITD